MQFNVGRIRRALLYCKFISRLETIIKFQLHVLPIENGFSDDSGLFAFYPFCRVWEKSNYLINNGENKYGTMTRSTTRKMEISKIEKPFLANSCVAKAVPEKYGNGNGKIRMINERNTQQINICLRNFKRHLARIRA